MGQISSHTARLCGEVLNSRLRAGRGPARLKLGVAVP